MKNDSSEMPGIKAGAILKLLVHMMLITPLVLIIYLLSFSLFKIARIKAITPTKNIITI